MTDADTRYDDLNAAEKLARATQGHPSLRRLRARHGGSVAEPVVPDRIELHATDEALDVARERADFRTRLGRREPGMKLYDLRLAPAIDAPAEPAGELVLDTAFVTPRYGDERLFFQHDRGPHDGEGQGT